MPPIVVPKRSFEEESSESCSARQSPLCQSPLAWRLNSPEVSKKLAESGVEEEVVYVVTELEENLKVVGDELEELKDENLKLRETIEDGEKERSAKTVEVVQLQGGLMTARQETRLLKNENVKLQTVLMTEVADLEEGKMVAQRQLSELQAEHDATLEELGRREEENFEITKQVSSLQEKLILTMEQSMENQKKLQMSLLKSSSLQAKVAKLQSKLATSQHEKSALWDEVTRLKADLSLVESEEEEVENLLREVVARRAVHKTSQVVKDLKLEISNVESALTRIKELDGNIFFLM